MVLNYTYYQMDLKTLYLNKSYLPKTNSDKGIEREGVMRNIVYDDYLETSAKTALVDTNFVCNELPHENPDVEIIFLREPSKWSRFWRFWRNVLSLKFCRRS